MVVLAVIATPPGVPWALAAHAVIVLGLATTARLPVRLLVRRLRIEVPFLVVAVAWQAWDLVAKGTIGALAAIVLAATTPVADLLAGFDRLRVPRVLTAIAGFMVRYLDVIVGEADRLRIARLSRADDPRWIGQARAVAATGGTLFVRTYERGERVHLAMLSRGWDGTMPDLAPVPAGAGGRAPRLVLLAPLVSVAVAVMARLA